MLPGLSDLVGWSRAQSLLTQRESERLLNWSRTNPAEAGLLDAPELAKRFGVPESWVREQARLGKLPFIRLGHYVRFRLEEVERFLAERANHAA